MSCFSDYTPGGQNMQHMKLTKGLNESFWTLLGGGLKLALPLSVQLGFIQQIFIKIIDFLFYLSSSSVIFSKELFKMYNSFFY